MAGSASLLKALAAQKQRLEASQQQPTNIPTNTQSNNQSEIKAVPQAAKQPTKQSNKQTKNQSNQQSNKQPAKPQNKQPVTQSNNVSQSTNQSNAQPTSQPLKLKRSRFDSSNTDNQSADQSNKRAKVATEPSDDTTTPAVEQPHKSQFQSINDAFAQSSNQPKQVNKQSNQSNNQSKKQSNKQSNNPTDQPSLLSTLQSRLSSGRFRFLNEQLYTMTSSLAYDYFQSNPSDFDAYHAGFREQVSKWPTNPLTEIIEYIQTKHIDQSNKQSGNDSSNHQWNKQSKQSKGPLVVVDMGCGDAVLSQTLDQKNNKPIKKSKKQSNNQSNDQSTEQPTDDSNKKVVIHSFDLISTNERVTACNISATPLEKDTADVVVFCLSLMGTDYDSFLTEAHRILKVKGELIIAEVTSRLAKHTNAVFIESVRRKGFRSHGQSINQYFSIFHFVKAHPHEKLSEKKAGKKGTPVVEGPVLTPCIYKKR